MCTRLFILLVFGLSLVPDKTAAQSLFTNDPNYWISTGAGLGVLPGATDQDIGESPSGTVAASYQFGPNLLSARTAAATELFRDSVYDIGLLCGRALSDDAFFASVGIGLGYVDGTRSEGLFSVTEPIDATVGVPLEMQLFYRPSRVVGVGLYGFANLNAEESFFGAAIGLQVGRFGR